MNSSCRLCLVIVSIAALATNSFGQEEPTEKANVFNRIGQSISYIPDSDKQLLQEKNIGSSTMQLWGFLANPMLPPWQPSLEKWLKPFRKTAKVYQERSHVLTSLEAKGLNGKKWPYLGTNVKGCYADRPEFVEDVKKVLVREHEVSLPRVVEAAIRLLAHQNPKGFAGEVVGLAPSLLKLDRRVEQTLIDALAKTALQDGKPDPRLLSATKSPGPTVRAFAIRGLLRAGIINADKAKELFDGEKESKVKWQIAMGLIDQKNTGAIPLLIELIPEIEGKDASHLEKLLHHIAGNGPALAFGDDRKTRLKAKDAWNAWWKENAGRVKGKQVSHGITFAFNRTHAVELDLSGNTVWELEFRPTLLGSPNCVQRLPNGNVVVCESASLSSWYGRRIAEVTSTGAVVWEREVVSVKTFERLKDGRILFGVFILGKDGKPTQLFPSGNCFHVRSNPKGGFVATQSGGTSVKGYATEFNNGPSFSKLTEVNADGKVERLTKVHDETTFGSKNWYFEFMENDHLLVVRGDDVMELDKDRKPVGVFAKGEYIDRIQRLENGNVLISIHGCGNAEVQEYTRKGKKIRSMKLPKYLQFVSRR